MIYEEENGLFLCCTNINKKSTNTTSMSMGTTMIMKTVILMGTTMPCPAGNGDC